MSGGGRDGSGVCLRLNQTTTVWKRLSLKHVKCFWAKWGFFTSSCLITARSFAFQGKLKENTVLSKDGWFCCAADWFLMSLMQNSQENELHYLCLAFKQKSQGSQSILETTGALTYQPGCSRCYLFWKLRGRRQLYLQMLHFYSGPYLCSSAAGIYNLVWAWAKGAHYHRPLIIFYKQI